MGAQNDALPRTGEGGITRLVSKAQRSGERDPYRGKRRWIRYKAGMRLDVTTDPAKSSNIQAAIMHNASGGGISFWMKGQLSHGETVFVREFPADERPGEWLEAHVRHCTPGIRGYLIGVRFRDPDPPGGDDAVCSDKASKEEAVAAPAAPVGTEMPLAGQPRRRLRGWFKRRHEY